MFILEFYVRSFSTSLMDSLSAKIISLSPSFIISSPLGIITSPPLIIAPITAFLGNLMSLSTLSTIDDF